MNFRPYNPKKDQQAVHRIWREVHWIKKEDHEEMTDVFLSDARALVADVNGEAECLVISQPGTMCYLNDDLKLSVVASVATSRVARKQGLAKQLTAELVAADAIAGAEVSALGMFEQGFYDQLGFGTGGYEHWVDFDPDQLTVRDKPRVPRRLTMDDWEMVHRARLARWRGHGGCNVLPQAVTRAQMSWIEDGFGLGYCDGPEGELTHFFWGSAKGEHGPYSINMMAYQNGQQLLELLALLRSLGDQVRAFKMREPQGIQLQDLLTHPLDHRDLTSKAEYKYKNVAVAYWQARICDLDKCLSHTHLSHEELRFNLKLHDPIEEHLKPDTRWRGLTGDYVITLGPQSRAERTTDPNLPTLTASVGAFTRLWLGVRPATGLAVTDELAGPETLLSALDRALRLPDPKPDWDF